MLSNEKNEKEFASYNENMDILFDSAALAQKFQFSF